MIDIGVMLFFIILGLAMAPGVFIISWVVFCRAASLIALKGTKSRKEIIDD